MKTAYVRFSVCLVFFTSAYSHEYLHEYLLEKAVACPASYPVVIVGGGNAGLTAALYTAREHINTLVLMGEQPGGLLVESSLVDNIPGIATQPGKHIMDTLQQKASAAGATLLYAGAENIDLRQWPFVVTLDNGDTAHALTLIIATGAAPKYLGIPGEEEYKGRGVSTCALCDGAFLDKDRDILVVGGGNSALEQALHLTSHARSVIIVHRSQTLRATPAVQERLKHYTTIALQLSTKLVEIKGDESGVTHVIAENTQTGQRFEIPAQGVFLAIGHEPRTHLFKEHLSCDEYGALLTINNGPQTAIQGVFAAGDVVDLVYRQAITAQAMGAQAAILATRFLQELGFTQQLQSKLKLYQPELFSEDEDIAE